MGNTSASFCAGGPSEYDNDARLRELEWKIIYAIIVAGKSAKFTQRAMDLFDAHRQERLPFEFVKILIEEENLGWVLRDIRTGNYTKIERALVELTKAEINLSTCTPDDLEKIHGIGPKTSRFFILWTRPDARYAALDVHVLRWLDLQGYDVPLTTPPPKKYAEIEKIFLAEADKRNMTPAQFDAQIWDAGANKSNRFQQELF